MTSSNGEQANVAFSAICDVLGGYKPGFELIKGIHPNAIERFVILYVKGSPRLLLPQDNRAMKTAVNSFLGSHRGASLLPQFIKTASWVGGPLASVCTDVSLTSPGNLPCPLRKLLSEVLGRNDFQLALRLSFDRPNAKTVAVAISDAGETLCFAKFGTEAMTNDLVAHESEVLERFEGTDMPVVLPQRLFSGAWAGGHNVLITASLPFRPLARDARIAHQAADAFALQTRVTSSTLGDSDYWRQVIARVKTFNEEDSQALLTLVNKIENGWGACNLDFGASHGDWTRANLGEVDSRVAALDWERCTPLAPRGIDIAHFAISETTKSPFKRSINIERVSKNVHQYLNAADQPTNNTKPLILLAMLEMIIRFKSAQNVGIRSNDSKFGSALNACLKKWA